MFATLVYCGQTAGWIKMPIGKEVGLGPGHIVLDRKPAPPKRETAPPFSVHACCGQTARWIKIPLAMEVDLGPGRPSGHNSHGSFFCGGRGCVPIRGELGPQLTQCGVGRGLYLHSGISIHPAV